MYEIGKIKKHMTTQHTKMKRPPPPTRKNGNSQKTFTSPKISKIMYGLPTHLHPKTGEVGGGVGLVGVLLKMLTL